MYPSLSRAYKRKVSDVALKDEVHELDRNMEVEFRTSGLDDVDNGEKVKFDVRANPERAGFPKGDSRRW